MNSRNTTSLSKRILGKDLNDLTYEYIESFFKEEREETENLEFKSGKGEFNKTLENNIIRTIAAFLNSSGGILIWGAPIEKKIEGETRKACFGDLTPLKESKDKDQLINKITGNISYMPTGVNLVKLENDNEYIYIFEVKESNSKPHQYNGIYYVRLDGQSKPAPHYLVDALFKQIKFPDLEAHIRWVSFDTTYPNLTTIKLKVLFFNLSPYVPAKNVEFYGIVQPGIFIEKNNYFFTSQNHPRIGYGVPPSTGLTIQVTKDQLEEKGFKIDFGLLFSADNLPLKSSKYVIDFNKYYNSDDLEVHQFVEEIYSCEFVHELDFESGLSRDDIINQHLLY